MVDKKEIYTNCTKGTSKHFIMKNANMFISQDRPTALHCKTHTCPFYNTYHYCVKQIGSGTAFPFFEQAGPTNFSTKNLIMVDVTVTHSTHDYLNLLPPEGYNSLLNGDSSWNIDNLMVEWVVFWVNDRKWEHH